VVECAKTPKPDELLAQIGEYDGLVIRSATTVTKEVLAAGKRLKVIGRAGVGVDNIDVPAATKCVCVFLRGPRAPPFTLTPPSPPSLPSPAAALW
jgi:D-3-phosphoglycerate dehydrogenase